VTSSVTEQGGTTSARRFIIGDIHGCWRTLRALLDKAGLNEADEVISIGDMVDGGGNSAGVLRYFRHTPHVCAIMGNHERKHVWSYRGQVAAGDAQVETRAQIGEADYPAALAWMAALPNYLDLPEALLVHGFYLPGVPLTGQPPMVLTGTLEGEALVRERCAWPWYEHYDGEKPLIVGHRDYTGQQQVLNFRDRVFGLDSRCVYGGNLSGLLLPEFRVVQVRSCE
jgi:serine/threonine protein phosphatase 1